MAITDHMIEGLIRVPSGGWPVDCSDSSGSFTATIPAGDYYMSSGVTTARGFIDELEYQINQSNGAGPDWAVHAMHYPDLGTFYIQVTGAFTVTWDADSTPVRDLLGLTANISATTAFTSTNKVRTSWSPGCPPQNLYGNSSHGWYESSTRGQVAPDGTGTIITGPRRTVNSLRWPAVALKRLLIAHESRANESYERFWLDCVQGELEGCVPGRVRWYHNADSALTTSINTFTSDYFVTYAMVGPEVEQFKHSPLVENWNGYFAVEMGRLVEQS